MSVDSLLGPVVADGVARIAIDRPGQMNALNAALRDGLNRAITDLSGRPTSAFSSSPEKAPATSPPTPTSPTSRPSMPPPHDASTKLGFVVTALKQELAAAASGDLDQAVAAEARIAAAPCGGEDQRPLMRKFLERKPESNFRKGGFHVSVRNCGKARESRAIPD